MIRKIVLNDSNVRYKFYTSLTDECRNIRRSVFVVEQGFQNEFDDIDNRAIHIVAYINNIAVGTARIFCGKSDGEYVIGRIAVLKDYRKCHIGSALISQAEEKARSLGARVISLSAQCRIKGFYEKMGFTAQGDIYYDEHCEHINMKKVLID